MSWSKARACGIVLAALCMTACPDDDDVDVDASVEDAGDNVNANGNGGDDAGLDAGDNGNGGSTGEENNGESNNGGSTGEENNGGSDGTTGASTGDSTGASTGDSTGASTGDSTGASTGDSTGASTGDSTGASTGDSTGASTGDSTGGSTGGDVFAWAAAGLEAGARATLLQTYLTSEAYATSSSWHSFFESTTAMRPLVVAAGSHNTRVRVFQNDIAYQASVAWANGGHLPPLDMPDRAVVVKENYREIMAAPGTYELVSTSVMAKIDALDETVFTVDPMTMMPTTQLMYEGDWFYVKITNPVLPATPVASHSPTCANCHNGKNQKTLWPAAVPADPLFPGGKTDAIKPYDYLFLAFCSDSTHNAPNARLCTPPL